MLQFGCDLLSLQKKLCNILKQYPVHTAAAAIYRKMDTDLIAHNVGVVMDVRRAFSKNIVIMHDDKVLKSK
jgi:hypothetical protein